MNKIERVIFSFIAGFFLLTFNIVAFRNGVFGLVSSRSDMALLGAPVLGAIILILDYYAIKFLYKFYTKKEEKLD